MEKNKLKSQIPAYIEYVAESAKISDYLKLKKLEIFISNFLDFGFKEELNKKNDE